MSVHNSILKSAPWLRGLNEEQTKRANQGITLHTYHAGEYVCRRGDKVEYWFGVKSGLVKMCSDLVSGKTSSYSGIPAGGWFGEGSLLKSEVRRYDVIALRQTEMIAMQRETFIWLLDNSISFNRFVMLQLNERLGHFISLLESERLLNADVKVARCIAGMFHPILYPEQNFHLQISQEELGYLVGLSRQRVNRSLKVLQQANLLQVEYSAIKLIDLDGLRKFGD